MSIDITEKIQTKMRSKAIGSVFRTSGSFPCTEKGEWITVLGNGLMWVKTIRTTTYEGAYWRECWVGQEFYVKNSEEEKWSHRCMLGLPRAQLDSKFSGQLFHDYFMF